VVVDLGHCEQRCRVISVRTGLGTCKHVEATLHYLEARHRRRFKEALQSESPVIDIVPDPAGDTLRIEGATIHLPDLLRRRFDRDGRLRGNEPEQFLEEIRKAHIPYLRISQQVPSWLQARQQTESTKSCSGNMNRKFSRENGPRRKLWRRFTRTSAKGCCTSPSRNEPS
jgi:hypothetical protein